MKRFSVFLIAVCFLVLSGCSDSGSSTDVDNGSLDVEKGLFGVTITLPASMVDSEDIEATIQEAREQGIKDVVLNDDGSLTYRMSKSVHKELMKELRENFNDTVEEMIADDDYPSIRDIHYNKELTSITMLVEKEIFENSFDSFAIMGLGLTAMFYQIFDGVQSDNLSATIDVVDIDTDEVLDTVVYPDDLDNTD
jgi:hypothetical protein